APGPIPGSCAAVPAPASATNTNGVAIPSLSPLSMLISRLILAGTARLSITPAPSAASVGARAAPTSSASQMFMPRTAPAPAASPDRSSVTAPPPAAADTGQGRLAGPAARPGTHQRTAPGQARPPPEP